MPSTGGGDATVSKPVTTIAAEVTNPSVVDGVSYDTTMSTDGLMSYDTLPQTQSTMFEGDVSIEDPLPEQAYVLTSATAPATRAAARRRESADRSGPRARRRDVSLRA